MALSQPPLPQSELARICEQKRAISAKYGKTSESAACTMAGL